MRRIRIPYQLLECNQISSRPFKFWATTLPQELTGIITVEQFQASMDRIQKTMNLNIFYLYLPFVLELAPIGILLLISILTGSWLWIYLTLVVGAIIGFASPWIVEYTERMQDREILTAVAAETRYYTVNQARVILDPTVKQLTWRIVSAKNPTGVMMMAFELEVEVQQEQQIEGQQRQAQQRPSNNDRVPQS